MEELDEQNYESNLSSRRNSNGDETDYGSVETADESSKDRFMLYFTFKLSFQPGVATVTKLGATKGTQERLLVACRDNTTRCFYFKSEAEGLLVPRSDEVGLFPTAKNCKISGLNAVRQTIGEKEIDWVVGISYTYLSRQQTQQQQMELSDVPSASTLSFIKLHPDDSTFLEAEYCATGLPTPPYGCNPVTWRKNYSGSSQSHDGGISAVISCQDSTFSSFNLQAFVDAGVVPENISGTVLPEASFFKDRLVAALEYWYYPENPEVLVALAYCCRSEIKLLKVDESSNDCTELWSIQHDSLARTLKFFMAFNRLFLLVSTLGEPVVIYQDVDQTTRPDSIMLEASTDYNLVTSVDICDVDRDGSPLILLGTYNLAVIVYKFDGVNSAAQLLQVLHVSSPVCYVSFIRIRREHLLDIAVVCQKGVHLFGAALC